MQSNAESVQGVYDEVRFRASALSAEWIATEFANQSDPATFATAGTPEEIGAAAVVSGSAWSSVGATAAAASGDLFIRATGLSTLGATATAVHGSLILWGDMAAELPALRGAAQQTEAVSAGAAASVAPLEVAGDGVLRARATGAMRAAGLDVGGSGTLRMTADVSGVIRTAIADAVGMIALDIMPSARRTLAAVKRPRRRIVRPGSRKLRPSVDTRTQT